MLSEQLLERTKVELVRFVLCVTTIASVAGLGHARTDRRPASPDQVSVTLSRKQYVSVEIEVDDLSDRIGLYNPTDLTGDVDVSAIDWNGDIIESRTVVVESFSKKDVQLKELFDELSPWKIQVLRVQASLRPEPNYESAVALPIAFFSQLDSRWANKQLGTCKKNVNGVWQPQTIRQIGCALTSFAMAGAATMSNSNPGAINSWLTSMNYYGAGGGSYSGGCNMDWDKAALYDGTYGFKRRGSGSVTSAANLKTLIDGGNYIIASSNRPGTVEHWSVIYKYHGTGTRLSDFEYLDPLDSSYVYRTVSDTPSGWVTTSSKTRYFK